MYMFLFFFSKKRELNVAGSLIRCSEAVRSTQSRSIQMSPPKGRRCSCAGCKKCPPSGILRSMAFVAEARPQRKAPTQCGRTQEM